MPISLNPDNKPVFIPLKAAGSRGREYKYPDKLKLKPDDDFHHAIVNQVMLRAKASNEVMKDRFSVFRSADKSLTSYIRLDEDEKKIKAKDDRKPLRIVVPLSFTALETLLTYLVAAFLDPPYFRYEGHGPEDTLAGIMLEKVIDMQCRHWVSEVGPDLHTFWRDGIAYGFGVVGSSWRVHKGFRVVRNNKSWTGLFGFGKSSPTLEETTLFEGNCLQNISPYNYLPDPNAPIEKPYKGNFVGWIQRTDLTSLIAEEATDKDMFNVSYLKEQGRAFTSKYTPDEEGKRNPKQTVRGSHLDDVGKIVDVVNMYVRLIPSDWELGKSDIPEWWFFRVAGDCVLLTAKRLGLAHDTPPLSSWAPHYDGYGNAPVSDLEIIQGMQQAADWYISSRMANVRKALNDMFIVDPGLVNLYDLADPRPGKLIRLRKRAWGRGRLREAVDQFKVQDVTMGHLTDVAAMTEMSQRATGATDIVQGIVRTGGERRSATEFRETKIGALSRLQKAASICSLQANNRIAYLFALHLQQFMSKTMWFKASGSWGEVLRSEYGSSLKVSGEHLRIDPWDICADYDIIPHDASVPSGEYADTWVQLFQVMATNPVVGQQFDTVRVFKHIARILGVKNVNEFMSGGGRLDMEALPTGEIEEQQRQGNIVPMEDLLTG